LVSRKLIKVCVEMIFLYLITFEAIHLIQNFVL
jgi:hypothetical protein